MQFSSNVTPEQRRNWRRATWTFLLTHAAGVFLLTVLVFNDAQIMRALVAGLLCLLMLSFRRQLAWRMHIQIVTDILHAAERSGAAHRAQRP